MINANARGPGLRRWMVCAGLASVAGCAVAPTEVAQRDHGEPHASAAEGAAEAQDRLEPGPVARMRAPATPEQMAAEAAIPVTTDLGEWRSVGPLNITGKVFALAQSRQHRGTWYVSYGHGVWKTQDAGTTWRAITDHGRIGVFVSVAVHPADDRFVVLGSGGSTYAGAAQDPGVHWSRDGGQTWTVTPVSPSASPISALVFHPTNPQILYAAACEGIYQTTDGGAHWTLRLAVPNPVKRVDLLPTLALDPGDPNHLLAQQRALGIQTSNDGGATWRAVAQSVATSDAGSSLLAFAPSSPSVAYLWTNPHALGSGPGDPSPNPDNDTVVYRSVDRGEHWARMNSVALDPHATYCRGSFQTIALALDVDPQNAEHVIGANCSYFTSRDGFSTAQYRAEYVRPVDILVTQFDVFDPAKVLIGGDQGLFHRNADIAGGVTATRVDTGVHSTHIYRLAANAGTDPRLVQSAGDYGKLLVGSTAAGSEASFSEIDALGSEYNDVVSHPYRDGTYFMLAGHASTVAVTRSTDGARSFDVVDPIAGRRTRSALMAFDPAAADTLWLSNDFSTASRALFVSKTGGAAGSWTPAGPALTAPAFDLVASRTRPTVLYLLGPGAPGAQSLYVSQNGGTSWIERAVATQFGAIARRLTVAPDDGSRLYVVTDGPFYDCTGYGATCTLASADLIAAGLPVRQAVVDPTDAARVFVRSDVGVYTALRGAWHWSKVGHNLPRFAAPDMRFDAGSLFVATNFGTWQLQRDVAAALPAAVTSTTAARSGTGEQIRVQWTATAAATRGYVLVRDALRRAFLPAGTTRWTDTPRDTDSHCYVVLAVDATGNESPWATPVCATALDRIFTNGFQ